MATNALSARSTLMQKHGSPIPKLHPGRSLALMLRTRGLDAKTAAAMVGLTEFELGEVMHERGDVTERLAAAFAELTYTTPDLWMTMQSEFDETRRSRPLAFS